MADQNKAAHDLGFLADRGVTAVQGARDYLARFMREHFEDRAFSYYIQHDLAGDFAFEMARAIANLAATPAVPAVDALTRYFPEAYSHPVGCVKMLRHPRGDWVNFADVQALLATPSTAPDRHPLADEYGCWGLYAESVLAAAPEATSERPEHETIVREGDNLTCTACGTSAPVGEQMGGTQVATDWPHHPGGPELDVSESAAAPADLMKLIEGAQKIAPALATRTYELTPIQVGWIVGKSLASEGEATERKPLTDREIIQMVYQQSICATNYVNLFSAHRDNLIDLARAIEQHHGITGGGK